MNWHQLSQQFLGLDNFDLNNPLLVVLTAHFHLPRMRGQNEQSKEDELQNGINDECLQIDQVQLDKEEVLGDQSKIQDDLHRRENSKRNGSRNRYDDLVKAQGDLLRRSQQEVLEFGSI